MVEQWNSVAQCGTVWHNVTQCGGTVWNNMVGKWNSVVEQCEMVW